jgi:hypothetical protein
MSALLVDLAAPIIHLLLALSRCRRISEMRSSNVAKHADPQGLAFADAGATVTAKVKNDAATAGAPEFSFTCGFILHTGLMVTVPFEIMPSD